MDKTYVIGTSRTNTDNNITKNYTRFFIAFVVSKEDDKILDVEANFVLNLTKSFVHEIFVGKNFIKDQDKIVKIVEESYLGRSQKPIIIAYKDALKKYIIAKN